MHIHRHTDTDGYTEQGMKRRSTETHSLINMHRHTHRRDRHTEQRMDIEGGR